MCGLFGVAGPGIVSEDFKVLDELMTVSQLRGIDGTGLAAGKSWNQERSHIFKLKGDAIYWRYSLSTNDEAKIYDIGNTYLIGHARKRTSGSSDADGAQPFSFSDIVGTHNGGLKWKFEGFKTDSEKLLSIVNANKDNLQGAINLTNKDDAIALVWLDRKKATLHFYRNDFRSLYFAFNEKRNVMYWASEDWFLSGILGRNGIPFELFYVTPNRHLSIKISDISCKNRLSKMAFEDINAPPEVKAEVIHIGGKKGSKYAQPHNETLKDLQDIPWMRDTNLLKDEYDEETIERMMH